MRKELHKGLPDWAKSWLYWAVTIIMAVAGGMLVYLHGIQPLRTRPNHFPTSQ